MSGVNYNLFFDNIVLKLQTDDSKNYLKVSVKFTLIRLDSNEVLEETPWFPLERIFDVGHIIKLATEIDRMKREDELKSMIIRHKQQKGEL